MSLVSYSAPALRSIFSRILRVRQVGLLRVYHLDQLLYSWIGRPIRADKKLICQRTRRVTTFLRPLLESSRRGEFRSIFDLLFFETSENRVPTKTHKADLDSPR